MISQAFADNVKEGSIILGGSVTTWAGALDYINQVIGISVGLLTIAFLVVRIVQMLRE